MTNNFYVTMTDTFMSGWGEAEGKTNKLVLVCDSYEQAEIVEENAKNRGDMKYVSIASTKPHYNPSKYHVQFKTIDDMASWYKEGHFTKEA
ncbi:hypothetical protein [Bacillus phage SWEP1]|nr:hypothetical protein [Bacillus phage SWEP1]